ncbi:Guanylate kinase [seawater metagenome]|uniref:Guanylate kinase n=1 Tax=seawater metagenome TaxID=1561972 RepID=A0A5E8CK41_9ZZZZ
MILCACQSCKDQVIKNDIFCKKHLIEYKKNEFGISLHLEQEWLNSLPIKGKLIILCGPSGVGKTLVLEKIRKTEKNLNHNLSDKIFSVTTRNQRIKELDNFEYEFIDQEIYDSAENNNLFLISKKIYNNYYGLPAIRIIRELVLGKIIIISLHQSVIKELKQKLSNVPIFCMYFLPPSYRVLELRQLHRLTNIEGLECLDSKKIIKKSNFDIENRLTRATEEINEYKKELKKLFDYKLIFGNNEKPLELTSLEEIKELINTFIG